MAVSRVLRVRLGHGRGWLMLVDADTVAWLREVGGSWTTSTAPLPRVRKHMRRGGDIHTAGWSLLRGRYATAGAAMAAAVERLGGAAWVQP